MKALLAAYLQQVVAYWAGVEAGVESGAIRLAYGSECLIWCFLRHNARDLHMCSCVGGPLHIHLRHG